MESLLISNEKTNNYVFKQTANTVTLCIIYYIIILCYCVYELRASIFDADNYSVEKKKTKRKKIFSLIYQACIDIVYYYYVY